MQGKSFHGLNMSRIEPPADENASRPVREAALPQGLICTSSRSFFASRILIFIVTFFPDFRSLHVAFSSSGAAMVNIPGHS